MASVNDKQTTIAVYVGDRDWLQARQLQASAERKQWQTMPDLVHALIESVQGAEEGA